VSFDCQKQAANYELNKQSFKSPSDTTAVVSDGDLNDYLSIAGSKAG